MADRELKRIAVIGSRDFEDYARLESVLEPHLPAGLFSGGAKGADAHAERVGVPVELHHPDGTVTD
jgi:hypothetical protein